MERTIGALWRRAVSAGHSFPAFLQESAGRWIEVAWSAAGERVDELAAGFLSLGVARGDRVAVLSRTRLEWTLCDYALASIGAVVVTIYETSSREQCEYFLTDSGATVLLCENGEQVAKTRGLGAGRVEHVVSFDDADGAEPLGAVAERGRDLLVEAPAAVAAASALVGEDDLLTLIYTSGTTGPPKGCMITHGNFVAELEGIAATGVFESGDRVLLFLPLAHNFGRLVQYCGVGIGLTIAHLPDYTRLSDALAEVRPHLLPSVPRVFEKAYGAIESSLASGGGAKARLARWAFEVGRSGAGGWRRRAADRLVFARIRRRFGGELRLAVSGGAALSPEILRFFAGCGILVLEGYGLSEVTSGCTMNRPSAYRFGTVGRALPGVELALADDGEILVRGPTVFRGYLGREEATAEVFAPEGWLRTGDVGELDDGYLRITDRKKELIVTAAGKKISPANLENELTTSPYVSQALVYGDAKPYIVALLAADRDEVRKAGKSEDEVEALLGEVVAAVNARVGRTEQVKRFAVLPREFSLEEGEMTPTLKLRRRVCAEHFRDEIERLYAREQVSPSG